jgi:uncharacterized protein (TIGR02266 family)
LPQSQEMSGKRKQQKKRHKRKSEERRPEVAPALPTPEQAMGAIVEAIVAPLLDSSSEGEADQSSAPSSEGATSSPPGEEHRAHPRVVVAVAVGLETESHFFAGLSGDVSAGGVFVQTYRDLPIGSDVEVQFDLPDAQLKAHGRVRWHRSNSESSPPGVGIAFENLGEDDREIIQRFCEKRAPLYYDVEHL